MNPWLQALLVFAAVTAAGACVLILAVAERIEERVQALAATVIEAERRRAIEAADRAWDTGRTRVMPPPPGHQR